MAPSVKRKSPETPGVHLPPTPSCLATYCNSTPKIAVTAWTFSPLSCRVTKDGQFRMNKDLGLGNVTARAVNLLTNLHCLCLKVKLSLHMYVGGWQISIKVAIPLNEYRGEADKLHKK